MKNLISKHRTPFLVRIIGWTGATMMGFTFLVGIAVPAPVICIFSILFFAIQLSSWQIANVGLIGWPAQSLEIYEEGLVLRTFAGAKQWRWSHVSQIRGDVPGDRYALQLQNFRGDTLKIEKLSRWRNAKNEIATRAGSLIYERTMNRILRGDFVEVTPTLKFSNRGMFTQNNKIQWEDIKSIDVQHDHVIISSPQIDNFRHRVDFHRDQTPNGFIYEKLIQTLWQDAVRVAQPVEPVCIVVNGIAFNSEGEMIH